MLLICSSAGPPLLHRSRSIERGSQRENVWRRSCLWEPSRSGWSELPGTTAFGKAAVAGRSLTDFSPLRNGVLVEAPLENSTGDAIVSEPWAGVVEMERHDGFYEPAMHAPADLGWAK